MKIGFLSADWSMSYRDSQGHPTPGGAGFYRCALIVNALRDAGHDVYYTGRGGTTNTGEICVVSWDQKQAWTGLDIIVMQRWMDDCTPDLIKKAQSLGQVIINDVDDWFDGVTPANQAFWGTHPSRNAKRNTNHYRKTLQASSLLTVSTPYLADRYRAIGVKNIEVLRNAVDLEMFERKPVKQTKKPVFGWVGAVPFRNNDLEELRGIIGPFLDKYGLLFHHAGYKEGYPSAAELMNISPSRSTHEPMQPIDRYPQMFKEIDVGLAPLSDIPFNYAKSNIKLMEYAASGIPFVSSNTPEYKIYGQGLIASKRKYWRNQLVKILDQNLRNELAENAYERVKQDDIRIRYKDWENLYQSLV